ncbi:MAG: acetyl-CoA carboxylase carboxyltransferase subunit beta [Acidobacteria bacterium]|nr:acetyl-CoA carboxylase carboxyltransferase subunit beta [Acidobacteriota bacterium]
MAWFRKQRSSKRPVGDRELDTAGKWTKCNHCREIVYRTEILDNASVCPKCDYHFRISSLDRLTALCDDGEWTEFSSELGPVDSLQFRDQKRYTERIEQYQERTGMKDAVVCAEASLGAIPVVFAVMEYSFMGGSMGSVVGEKIALAAERAAATRRPLIVISCSGGARMQEGAQSLMQMAKISAALAKLREAGIPFISVLTDPTTGGVTASYAMLGDINLAEPGALIGFAGPRVIEQTIREKLPEGFQRSEFLLEHGMLDMVVPRTEMKPTLAKVLRHLTGATKSAPSDAVAAEQAIS